MRSRRLPAALPLGAAIVLSGSVGCERSFDPSLASRPYPMDLHRAVSVDIQVFRDRRHLEIVNTTAQTYRDVDVWLNQRFVRHLDALPAGMSARMPLWEFIDERGERFNAGGFWRTEAPAPLRLVQLQVAEDAPLVGLVLVEDEK